MKVYITSIQTIQYVLQCKVVESYGLIFSKLFKGQSLLPNSDNIRGSTRWDCVKCSY